MDKNEETIDQGSETSDDTTPEIRVTDRRRFYLDDNGRSGPKTAGNTPSLKPTYVEELEARAEAAEKLVLEVQSRFEQLSAKLRREMEETRQRLNRAADERAQLEIANFVASVLPVLDNLQRATEAAETGSPADQIVEGVRRTAVSFENALNLAGVEPMESVGQPFDPELHEAVETVEVPPEMEGMVVAEYTRGYKIGDRLLRPARVKVGRAAESLTSRANSC